MVSVRSLLKPGALADVEAVQRPREIDAQVVAAGAPTLARFLKFLQGTVSA